MSTVCGLCGTKLDALPQPKGTIAAVKFNPCNAPDRTVVVCWVCARDAACAFASCERAELTEAERTAPRAQWPGERLTGVLHPRAKLRDGIRSAAPPEGGAA